MQGVGPGAVLGGRYVLQGRLSHRPDLEHWSAHDSTLQREVALTVVSSDHPNCAGVLDAARRAAGVEDTRLVRILDVGTEEHFSFIVEEAVNGSESLATILLQGPMPAEEARRVAGETAKGLESAGQRGLHHLRLTPHHVLIAPDGAVRVSGVAVAAAADGPDAREPDSSTALRRDAVSLVAIVYAALTGRWPLDENIPGVESAPKVVDGVVAPSEIVAGVPGDLDTLCRTTLNESAGPLTPGVMANRIAPWSRERVHRAGVDPTVVLHLPGPADVNRDVPDRAGEAVAATAGAFPAAPPREPSSDPAHPSPPPATPAPDTSAPAVAASATGRAAAAGAATTRVLGSVMAGAGAAAGVVGSKLSSLGKPMEETPEKPTDETSAQKGAQTSSSHGNGRMKLPTGILGEIDEIEPPLPMLPASTALPPSRGQSKLVMLIMAGFVGLALFVGYHGLVGLGNSTNLGNPTPRRTVIVKAPPVTVPASPAPQAASTAAGPIAILSATGFDPQGDGQESNSQAARVYDGNLTTAWSSELYQTADFGNLKKGVGLLLDLGQPTSVHQVTIDLGNGPVDLTVYAATDPSLQNATELGSATQASGRIQIKAASPMKETQYVIVWFTKLAQDGGQYGASISEIALN